MKIEIFTDFDDKPNSLNQKVKYFKWIKLQVGKALTDLTNKIAQIPEKGYDFLLGRMYFPDFDGYQNFLVFAPVLRSLILDSNKKVTNWMSTGISSEKIKTFDTSFQPTMSKSANDRVTLNSTTLF